MFVIFLLLYFNFNPHSMDHAIPTVPHLRRALRLPAAHVATLPLHYRSLFGRLPRAPHRATLRTPRVWRPSKHALGVSRASSHASSSALASPIDYSCTTQDSTIPGGLEPPPCHRSLCTILFFSSGKMVVDDKYV